jgi:hypothetical protein
MNCYGHNKIENIINELNNPDDVSLIDLSLFMKMFKFAFELKEDDSYLILEIVKILDFINKIDLYYSENDFQYTERITVKRDLSLYINYLFDYQLDSNKTPRQKVSKVNKNINLIIQKNGINLDYLPVFNYEDNLIFQDDKPKTFAENIKTRLLSIVSMVNINLFEFNQKYKAIFSYLYTCKSYICQYIDISTNDAMFNFLKNILGPSIRILGNYSINAIVNFVFVMCNTEDMLYYTMNKYSIKYGEKLGGIVSNTEISRAIIVETSKAENLSEQIKDLIPLESKKIREKYRRFNKQFGIDRKEINDIVSTINSLNEREIKNLGLRLSENKSNIEEALESKALIVKQKESFYEVRGEEDLENFMELLDLSTNNELNGAKKEILEYLKSVIKHSFTKKRALEKELAELKIRNQSTLVIETDLNNINYVLNEIKKSCDLHNLSYLYDEAVEESYTEISKENYDALKKFLFPMKKLLEPTFELIKNILRKFNIREGSENKILLAITSTLFIAFYHIQNFSNNLKYLYRGVEDKLRELLNMTKIPGKKPVFKPMKLKLGLSGLVMILVSNLIIFSPNIVEIMNIKIEKFGLDEERERMNVLGMY